MPRREFFLLGPFRATLGGEPLADITSPKLQGLLAYLALGAQQPQPRPQVATLLWPEHSASRTAHNLRQAIYRLNKLLALPDLPDPLQVTRHTVALNPAADLWFDAAYLQQILRQTAAHQHERLERCPACLARLEAAVAHVRGPLLEGVDLASEPFEEWLRPRRDRLQQQVIEALGHLAAAYQEQGAYRRAQEVANRQVQLAPWHERGYRQLIRALAAQGSRTGALAQFDRMQAALRDHLDVEPSDPSRQLAAAIRSGAFMPQQPRQPLHNLPPQHTPFIGRASEMAQIAERLQDPTCRLLTLVGPGGAGKSRLAIEAARAYATDHDVGATFVPLAATAAENVATAILAALNVPLLHNDRGGAQQQLLQVLREQERLLILDNYEHLMPQTGLVQQILQHAPGVHLLVTSRQRLALRAEWVLDIAGLPFPPSTTRATDAETGDADSVVTTGPFDAVELFVALARRLDGDFALGADLQAPAARLSRLLGGLPLALELAAALVRDLSIHEIVAAVARNLDVLQTEMPDVDPRHRGLRAVFNHSWILLHEAEQDALRRLAIFPRDFTARAATVVTQAPAGLLDSLVDKSLLQSSAGRYRLHAVLHQYAREKLQTHPSLARETATAHSAYYLDLLQQTATAPPAQARAAVAADIENVRAAWRHAAQYRPDHLLPALPGLVRFYVQAAYLQEGHAVLGQTLEYVMQDEALASRLLPLQAHLSAEQLPFTYGLARYDLLRTLAQDALRLGREAGEPGVVAQANMYLGAALARQGAYKEAGEFLDTAREQAQQAARPRLVADCLRIAGHVAVRLGAYAAAERHYAVSLDVARREGYKRGEGHALNGLGNVALVQDKPLLARERYEAALQVLTASTIADGAAVEAAATYGEPLAAATYGEPLAAATARENLATTYWAVGHYLQAAAIYRQNLAVRRRVGDRRGEGASLLRLAIQDHYSGDLRSGLDGYLAALAIFQDIGYRRGEGEALAHLCLLRHHQGDHARAVTLGRQAEAIARANHDRSDLAYALTFLAHALTAGAAQGDGAAAYEEALALRQEIGEKNRAVEPRAGLAQLALAASHTAEALSHVETILAHLQSGNLHVVDEPARIYLAAIRILQALDDPRAAALLHEARAFIHQRAALLDDRAPLFLQLPPNAALLQLR